MAIDTTNKKMAVMEWGLGSDPGLPVSPGSLGVDDQWQLLGEYLLNTLSGGGSSVGKLRGVTRAIARGIGRS